MIRSNIHVPLIMILSGNKLQLGLHDTIRMVYFIFLELPVCPENKREQQNRLYQYIDGETNPETCQ